MLLITLVCSAVQQLPSEYEEIQISSVGLDELPGEQSDKPVIDTEVEPLEDFPEDDKDPAPVTTDSSQPPVVDGENTGDAPVVDEEDKKKEPNPPIEPVNEQDTPKDDSADIPVNNQEVDPILTTTNTPEQDPVDTKEGETTTIPPADGQESTQEDGTTEKTPEQKPEPTTPEQKKVPTTPEQKQKPTTPVLCVRVAKRNLMKRNIEKRNLERRNIEIMISRIRSRR